MGIVITHNYSAYIVVLSIIALWLFMTYLVIA
jgi:hypothetical protein